MKLLLVALVSLMLAACGGSSGSATGSAGTNGTNGTNGINGLTSLVSVVSEPAGANCPAGGYRLNHGPDSNGDGTLQTTEISAVSFICNGANGTNGINGLNSLIHTSPEPSGANCVFGGVKIEVGLDFNADGTLQTSEVNPTATQFVCNAPVGSSGVLAAVSGLGTGNTLSLVLNGGAPIAINANGAFVLGNGLSSGSNYTVTVGTQPAGQTCTITGGSGPVVAGSFVGVGVSCEDILFAYVANIAGNNVSAYRINPLTGAFTEVAGSPIAAGNQPAAVAVDPSGKFVYVANSGGRNVSGNVSAYAINRTTGALTAVAGSPFAAERNPSSVAVDSSGKFVYVTNYNSNTVSAYSINHATGALTAVAGSPFATDWYPTSVTADPNGKFIYVTGNLDTVSVYSINPTTGALTIVAGSPYATGSQPGSMAVHPSGKFAYVANLAYVPPQTGFSISAYIIGPTTGTLVAVAGSPFTAGNTPNSIRIDPSGNFVYAVNLFGGSVSAYSINQTTGALTAVVGSPFFTAGIQPNAVAFDPTGQFAYTVNTNSNNISAYRINSATGALTALAGNPFAAGFGPFAIVTVRPR